MKRFGGLLLILCLLLLLVPWAAGAATSVWVTVDGRLLSLAAMEEQGKLLLPLRPIAEALGASLGWEASTHRVFVWYGGRTIEQKEPRLIAGRTHVPLDFFSQEMGAIVTADRAQRMIAISRGEEGVAVTHPLDPLTADEIRRATAVIKQANLALPGASFVQLTLHDPPKEEVLFYRDGLPLRRQAVAILFDRQRRQVVEAVVDLAGDKLISTRTVPDARPPFLDADEEIVNEVTLADPAFQAAMRQRGISDLSRIYLDVWAPGYFGIPAEEGRRLMRATPFYVDPESTTNAYARPIEGVVVYIDLDEKRVLQVIDIGLGPLPTRNEELDEASIGSQQIGPLLVTQPEGVNFSVQGWQVRWQNWQFRWSLHPRQGLTLHDVRIQDGERSRPVLYSAALSEMVVPYADPDPTFFWRNAFDVGEYGLGWSTHKLEVGKQCPNNAAFFDVTFADEAGEPTVYPQAVCLFERDGDLAWTHYQMGLGDITESRRQQELVIRFMSVIGNYDYGLDWIFRPDGSLAHEAVLTGILEPKGVHSQRVTDPTAGQETQNGALVAPHVVAPYHQHFFNYRLDFDVDGPKNTAVEVEVVSQPPGEENPWGNGFMVQERALRTEQEAQRDLHLATHREWQVINPGQQNGLGYRTGYKLVPGENGVPYAAPGAWVRKRAGFTAHHLFVTPYQPHEVYAAGDYPNQSQRDEGLPAWTAANRPIADTDLVLWYTMGLTHVTRAEEWPIMNAHRMGFTLVPVQFFERNPVNQLPGK